MRKYKLVQDIVSKLTSNPAFKTFFTIYLMAESEEEKAKIEKNFWSELDKLPTDERQLMNAEFTRTFLQLPALAEDLRKRVQNDKLAA